MRLVFVSPRSCAVLVDEQGDYYTGNPYELTVNGQAVAHERQSVVSIYGLWPDTEYEIVCRAEGEAEQRLMFRTTAETCTFDVRRFGAKGDGVHEDTAALQTAILCCPAVNPLSSSLIACSATGVPPTRCSSTILATFSG